VTGWTTADIPDLAGRTAIVTGANSGLGLVTARELARAGARVILACRDIDKGAAAAASMIGEVEVRRLDLASLASVRTFAAGVEEPVSLLINNAGLFTFRRDVTADGFELHLGVNHLGHFALTGLLLDRLVDRVVTVSSLFHARARLGIRAVGEQRRPSRRSAYGQSKLANLLFALELQRRLARHDLSLISLAAHPGYTATNLSRRSVPVLNALGRAMDTIAAQGVEQGALPLLYAATEPDLPGGCYIGPTGLGEMRGPPGLAVIGTRAQDPELAERLWELSERLTGVRFSF
jgi:NAD(P)-dependent dehydrogenase (short-subunit alcohol dehydrogenase family)